MKAGDHARREKHRFPARELGVIHLAAPKDLVFQHPGERRLHVLLDVAGHHRVAAATDRHVKRRPWSSRIREAGGKADLLDEPLGFESGFDLSRGLATPAPVAIFLNVRGKLRLGSHRLSGQLSNTACGGQ
jgi:hypothetical protein